MAVVGWETTVTGVASFSKRSSDFFSLVTRVEFSSWDSPLPLFRLLGVPRSFCSRVTSECVHTLELLLERRSCRGPFSSLLVDVLPVGSSGVGSVKASCSASAVACFQELVSRGVKRVNFILLRERRLLYDPSVSV